MSDLDQPELTCELGDVVERGPCLAALVEQVAVPRPRDEEGE